MMKPAEILTRAYETYEGQYGRTAEMGIDEMRNRTDLTDAQIREGLAEIAANCRGRRGDLAMAADTIERF